MTTIRRLTLLIAAVLAVGACGADGTSEEEPSAAPQTAPGVEPAPVPESLQDDSAHVG